MEPGNVRPRKGKKVLQGSHFNKKRGHKIYVAWERSREVERTRWIWDHWREEIAGECDQHTLYDSIKELIEIKQKC